MKLPNTNLEAELYLEDNVLPPELHYADVVLDFEFCEGGTYVITVQGDDRIRLAIPVFTMQIIAHAALQNNRNLGASLGMIPDNIKEDD